MTGPDVLVPGLPACQWLIEPEKWAVDENAGALTLVAPPRSDLIHEPLAGVRVTDAPALFFPVAGEFSLSAYVALELPDQRWSAGTLLLWQDQDHWAKLCLERSHHDVPSIITVVTNTWSDDAVHWPLDTDECFLRVLRTGDSFVMHASGDGQTWEFVRVFRFVGGHGQLRAGFLTQAPQGNGCRATFSRIRYGATVPADVRDGT